jgi:O-antigen/teichoic acid export membrane protein
MINLNQSKLIFIDQSIVSGSNFLISILVLRFIGIESFGIFSFIWLLLNFINSVQLAYIISPLLTNAPKQKKSEINLFYGHTLIQQFFFTLLTFIFSLYFLEYLGIFIKSYEIEKFSLSFSLIILFSQFYQYLRRICFSKNLFLKATISDFILYLLIISSLIYLNFFNDLDLSKILWVFVISFSIGVLFNLSLISSFNYSIKKLPHFIRQNWIISKWLLSTSIIQWFSGNLWIINTGIILGPYILGIVRSCQTILNIANIVFQSLENIIPTIASKKFMTRGKKYMDIFLSKILRTGLFFTMCLSIIILLFAKPILYFFYGNEIANYSEILVFMSFLIPLHFLQYPSTYGLRTLSKTRPIFISHLITSTIAILISIHVISYLKMYGFIFGLYFSQMIITSYLYISYKRYLNN